MSLSPVFTGTVQHGLTLLDRPKDYQTWVRSLEGQRIELVVRKARSKRSTQANRRYWALLTVGARELGYDDVEELHEGVAMKFLRLPDDERTGLPRRQRTPKQSTAEFATYMETVERFFRNDLHLDLSGWDEEIDRIEAAL